MDAVYLNKNQVCQDALYNFIITLTLFNSYYIHASKIDVILEKSFNEIYNWDRYNIKSFVEID